MLARPRGTSAIEDSRVSRSKPPLRLRRIDTAPGVVDRVGGCLSPSERALRKTTARPYACQSRSAGMTSFAKARSIAMS